MLRDALFTILALTLKDEKKKKTLPCAENLGQVPRNLGDHQKIQIIKRHTLSSSAMWKSALSESRAIPEGKVLLGESQWNFNQV